MGWRLRWFAARVAGNIRAKLLAGVLVLVPLVITYLVLQFVFVNLDGVLQPVVTALVGRTIPGAGLVSTLILLYIAGVVATNIFGARLVRGAERVLDRMPVVRALYTTSKKALNAVARTEAPPFKRVVLVEYPRRGLYAIGFVTGQFPGPSGETLVTVFLPATPLPTGGILTIVPEGDVIATDMTVDEGIKLIISGGILSPERLRRDAGQEKAGIEDRPRG
ncbi:MAG: DUF502 domain-containing protein [Chloroflexi bacterium]|nr:DUF502 domain-containing protein [Chloroflexota bacterium]